MSEADAEKLKAQLERYKDTARKAQTGDSKEALDQSLKKLAMRPL